MLSRKRHHILLTLLVQTMLVAGLTAITSEAFQKKDRNRSQAPLVPPVVVLESDTAYITLCPGSDSPPISQVQLRAATRNFTTGTVRYTYSTTGGRIVGGGANVSWDLSGVRPGTYTATVEADNGLGRECVAFASTRIIINECPPPRPFCPNVAIYCPDTVTLGAPVTFTANLSGGTPNVTPVYNWTVSAGRILSGQGTSSITVDTAGLGGQAIRATVAVGGYDLNCTATCTTQIPAAIDVRRFDQYPNVRFNDEKARLDNFAIQLQNEPATRGYIIAYGSRRGRVDEGRVRGGRARDYLVNERGIEASRIVLIDGGYQEDLTIELWLVPTGADTPKPRPGVTYSGPTGTSRPSRRRPK